MGPRAHAAQGDPLRVDSETADPRVGSPTEFAHIELVDLARGGDRSAFEELVRVTSGDIYALAFRLSGDEQDARDIVQETYLRAYRSIRKFRGEASFSTWLYRITANCASTARGRRRRLRQVSIDSDPRWADLPADPDPDALASATVERDRLVRALRALPLAQRTVIVLRDVYGLTHEEIATELGISGAATRVRLHRARRQLRASVVPETAGGSPARAEGDAEVIPVRSIEPRGDDARAV
ncbi:MAG TPA: sigma-70 family RNA polymerase sigma factor [Acidimicrobiales bacterium]|jgi:RNA polymerase sigma-70 factor (ECF subfamily)|nr:sigma-70 family RNA polymerase sigma factor [Acidimicrobiales bacterium]